MIRLIEPGGFVPRRVELLTDDEILHMESARFTELWMENEYRLCSSPVRDSPDEGWLYWLENYGVIQDKSGGPLHALELRDWQRDKFARALGAETIVCFLKTRQAGGTTIITHYIAWEMGIASDTEGTRHFASSNNTDNAEDILSRTREILLCQPSWLRTAVGPESVDPLTGKDGVDNTKKFECPERRTSLKAVAASARSVRSGAARTYTGDESAWPPEGVNPEDWITASIPTTMGGGKAFYLSTGNGDDTGGGAGRAFARMFRQGQQGLNGIYSLFVGKNEDPGFKQEAYDAVEAISGTNAAKQEYPDTPEDALAGKSEGKAYNAEHIASCVAKGREFDAMRKAGTLPPPMDGAFFGSLDPGLNMSGLCIYPIKGHGYYVCAEVLKKKTEPISNEVYATRFLQRLVEFEQGPKWNKTARLSAIYFDEGRKDFGYTLRDAREHIDPEIDINAVGFGTHQNGKPSQKELTAEFIRTLARRTFEGQDIGWLAISEDCKQLVIELLGMQVDVDAKIKKPKEGQGLDNTHDALIAGLAHAYWEWRAEYSAV